MSGSVATPATQASSRVRVQIAQLRYTPRTKKLVVFPDEVAVNLATPALTNLTVYGNNTPPAKGLATDAAHSGTITVDRSTLKGTVNSVAAASAATTIRIGASQLNGSVSPGAGTLTCVASYSGAFAALNSTCN